ncbi:MAG: hypothetical protein KGJ55_02535 [Gammaproteobacteria bacterium]|nr:hypothetical protein [Gammaproteobacteria bacterium]
MKIDDDWMKALGRSARFYPYQCDLPGQTFCFIALDEDGYRQQSFLDRRALTPGAWHGWLDRRSVNRELARIAPELPLHFIFHTGHAGSTLVSRLLDWLSPILPLREPLPLRQLCDALDTGSADATLQPMWSTTWRLWRRGFQDTRAVIVKATSYCARHAQAIIQTHPRSRAIYLGLGAHQHLATLLSKPGTLSDLGGFRDERLARLQSMLGFAPPPLMTAGELAAMSWLCEDLTRRRALQAVGDRILDVDFDALLDEPRQHLQRILRHLNLPFDPVRLRDVANCPLFGQYSKATDFHYTPKLRAELLQQTRLEHAREIRRGRRWLERLGHDSTVVASLLGEQSRHY